MFIYIFSISVVEESHLKRQGSTDADTQTSFFLDLTTLPVGMRYVLLGC